MEMFAELKEAVIKGEESRTHALTKEMLERRIPPQDILNQGLLAGIEVVGQKFKVYEMYLPEVIMSATAMKSAMELLRPLLSRSAGAMLGKVVMATIQGDLHDIGKNLVSMMLIGSGFEVADLGVDVQVSRIIQRAKEENAQIIGISALLTTNMLAMGPALKMIREQDPAAKVMVGGAPVTQEYARQIGADGWAPDALQSIHVAKGLAGQP